jgi:tetratricopeptide (TPR) repeat protein
MQSAVISTIEPIVSALQFGQPQEAERLARAYLAEHPANEDGLLLLSMSLIQQERPAEATMICRELTWIAPQSAIYWSNLGTVLRDAGELRAAEDAYREAIRLDPNFFGALLNLGYLLLEGGKFPEARDALLAAHALDPKSPEARIYSAQTCVALDRRDVAAQLIAPWPTWTDLTEELTVDLAGLMVAAGTPDIGARILESLLRRSPDNLRAVANLVFLYERINRLDEARGLLAKLPPIRNCSMTSSAPTRRLRCAKRIRRARARCCNGWSTSSKPRPPRNSRHGVPAICIRRSRKCTTRKATSTRRWMHWRSRTSASSHWRARPYRN